MIAITFMEAAKLKSYVWEHFKSNLHIHDTCGGGLYFSLDEKNDRAIEFVVAYFKARGIETEVSSDGMSVFLVETSPVNKKNITIRYEKDSKRTAAYDESTLIGECTYRVDHSGWVIEHTYVDAAYRNQKIARKLVLALLDEAKSEHIRVTAECSYAQKYL